jgi:predicted DNA-binding transcriptional regulator AlpA
MAEKLLTPIEVSRKLGISKAKFYRLRARLTARGMKKITVGGSPKYLESSIDRMIIRSAEKDQPLC